MSPTVQQALSLADTNSHHRLSLVFGGKRLSKGQEVPRGVAESPPKLSMTGELQGPYIAICIDLDAPYVSAPVLAPILHWIQPGLEPNGDGVLEAKSKSSVDWAAPAPPPLSGAHRYVFMIYHQPASFAKWEQQFEKPNGLFARVRWDADEFVKVAGLGEMVAASWFASV